MVNQCEQAKENGKMVQIRLVLVLILLMTFGAYMPGTVRAGPELPGGPVPVSEEAANRLDEKIIAAYEQAYADPNHEFTLRATDEEVTSWFVYRVAVMPENNIKDPQIRFTGGKIHSAVTMVGVLPFELRIKLVATFQVVNGQVHFQVESSSAGFLPVPKEITNLLPQSDMVNDMLTEFGIELSDVKILEGEMAVSGHLLETAMQTAG
jgi:hypothetical protein